MLGSIDYFEFILKIYIGHIGHDKSLLSSMIKDCFTASCGRGRIDLAKMLYEDFNIEPLRYDIKISFSDILDNAFSNCLYEFTNNIVSNSKFYLETVEWLHKISRTNKNIPINISLERIDLINYAYETTDGARYRQIYPSDMISLLEKLISENVYDF